MSSNRDFTFLNKDDDFSVVLLSNDKKTERMSEEDSIRSHFKSILPVHLDLSKGQWEIAVDKVILSNRQNNAMKLRVSSKSGKILKDVDFTPGVYDTTYEVLDDFINLGNKTTLPFDLIDEEFMVGDYDPVKKNIGSLNKVFSMKLALDKFEKKFNRGPTNVGEIFEAMTLEVEDKYLQVYDRFTYNADIDLNPTSIFKLGSSPIKDPQQLGGSGLLSKLIFQGGIVKVVLMIGCLILNNHRLPLFWVSDKLGKVLYLDQFSTLFDDSPFQISRVSNLLGKTGFLLKGKKWDSMIIFKKGHELTKIKGEKLLAIETVGDEIIIKSPFKIEFVNRDGKVTYTNPYEFKFKKDNVRASLNLEIKNLVEKDVTVVNLYLPSLNVVRPIFLDSSKEDSLFDVNIRLQKGKETILHETRRERQYYLVEQTREREISVLLRESETGLVPKFWYGFSLIVLHVRKARRNWFEQF